MNTSKFAKSVNLVILKLDVDRLDIDKSLINHVDLSNLINVVKNDVVQNTVYN